MQTHPGVQFFGFPYTVTLQAINVCIVLGFIREYSQPHPWRPSTCKFLQLLASCRLQSLTPCTDPRHPRGLNKENP